MLNHSYGRAFRSMSREKRRMLFPQKDPV